jgi:hypothetical protein
MKRNLIISFLFSVSFHFGQSINDLQNIGYLLQDALLYSDRFITPATDGAVFQASTAWMTTAKKKKLWELDLGIHFNAFQVPTSNRSFQLRNSELSFFQFENPNISEASVPTALGNDTQYFLSGTLFGDVLRVKTPEGIDRSIMTYPYLHISLGLPFGTELITRTSSLTSLEGGYYQVYGYGLKHSISQYFSGLEKRKINVAIQPNYSHEEVVFDFLDIPSNFGSLGINKIKSQIDTYHLILGVSKEYKNWEFLGTFVANYSNFNYEVSGEKSSLESIIAIQEIVNLEFEKIEEPQYHYLGEFTTRYSFKKWQLVTTFSAGKYLNANFGLQYKLN